MQNLRRVGKNSGPILSCLWTKVHKILTMCRRPLVVSNAFCRLCISNLSFRRPLNLPLSCEVVKNKMFLGSCFVGEYPVAAGRGAKGVSCASGGTVEGRHLKNRKYGWMTSGRFWRISVCIADSDILHPPNTRNTVTVPSFWATPQLSVLHDPTQSSVYTKTLCWSDWSFTCCKTVKDRYYCPVTVLLAIAIQCFALFTCFQILHKIWKFLQEIWSIDSRENL